MYTQGKQYGQNLLLKPSHLLSVTRGVSSAPLRIGTDIIPLMRSKISKPRVSTHASVLKTVSTTHPLTLPDSFDWRNWNDVDTYYNGGVRKNPDFHDRVPLTQFEFGIIPWSDQGLCGQCWAISSSTISSDRLAILTNRNSQTDPTIRLNTSMLCFNVPGSGCHEAGLPSDASVCGCYGNDPTNAGDYITTTGLVSESVLPISWWCPQSHPAIINGLSDYTCGMKDFGLISEFRQRLEWSRKHKPIYRAVTNPTQHSTVRTLGSIEEMKREILINGPIIGVINCAQDFVHVMDEQSSAFGWLPTHGVYIMGKYTTDSSDGKRKGVRPDVEGGHAISVIGWGRDDSLEEPHKQYWIIRNSWTENWGPAKDGCCKIAMNQPNVGLDAQSDGAGACSWLMNPIPQTHHIRKSPHKIFWLLILIVIVILAGWLLLRFARSSSRSRSGEI